MANYKLKFIDECGTDSIEVTKDVDVIRICTYYDSEIVGVINLDKSTAIKFAKTLRTEINKIVE